MMKNLTDEQRQENLEKARLSRIAKIEWAEDNLKLEYEDEWLWLELAKGVGIRLPQRHIPNTETKYLKRIAKTLETDIMDYVKDQGVNSLKGFVTLNHRFNARAECGLYLEYLESEGKIPARVSKVG